jgi:hypothetical protein
MVVTHDRYFLENAVETLVGRWEEIIKELSGLFEMRRGFRGGAVCRNPREGRHKSPAGALCPKEKARTVSRRLSDPGLVETYRGQIQAFRRFQELTQ